MNSIKCKVCKHWNNWRTCKYCCHSSLHTFSQGQYDNDNILKGIYMRDACSTADITDCHRFPQHVCIMCIKHASRIRNNNEDPGSGIPDISHFVYTGKIFGERIYTKKLVNYNKWISRQNSVNRDLLGKVNTNRV